MGWHTVVAHWSGAESPSYFVAYRDNSDRSECVWAHDRWQAKWLEASEARIEAELLALLCPGYVVTVQPLSIADVP